MRPGSLSDNPFMCYLRVTAAATLRLGRRKWDMLLRPGALARMQRPAKEHERAGDDQTDSGLQRDLLPVACRVKQVVMMRIGALQAACVPNRNLADLGSPSELRISASEIRSLGMR